MTMSHEEMCEWLRLLGHTPYKQLEVCRDLCAHRVTDRMSVENLEVVDCAIAYLTPLLHTTVDLKEPEHHGE